MNKKKAKLHINITLLIIEEGNFVVCAVSGKEIPLSKLRLLECRSSRSLFFTARS